MLGATGATGRLVARELLERGWRVRAIVRSRERLREAVGEHDRLSVVEGEALALDDAPFAEQVEGCDAIVSCLGHSLSARGIWGPPYRLVTDALRRTVAAIRAARGPSPTRVVLMGTSGFVDRAAGERVSLAQNAVLALLRLLVPPHADNERAAEYLRDDVGPNDPLVQWAVVRPDSLIDEAEVKPYDVHPSPTRSAIFDAGKVSRAQVAHFMTELAVGGEAWDEWRRRLPVIYAQGS